MIVFIINLIVFKPFFMGKNYNIAMITDFYYPSTGGIETHIRYLSKNLIKLGHKVVIITHKHSNMKENIDFSDLKVYALDFPILALNTTFPSLYSNFYILKKIFEDEKIDIVHGHQTMSNLCLEGIFHATTLNLKTIVTEHSLFEMGPFENVIVNSFANFLLKNVDKCICVSKTSKINFLERINIDSKNVHVVPNAVISEKFYPVYNKKKTKNVIVMSRLVFRKGIDLLVDALPLICKADNEIKIFIAGDGPKKDEILQAIDVHHLESQVSLIGSISHDEVGDFLRQGDVFLNTSLTETFCLAILEASMCGLHVISTNVGGIHEVLPNNLITFCKPTAEDLAKKVIYKLQNNNFKEIYESYNFLKNKYSWINVAKSTEVIYNEIIEKELNLSDRLKLCENIFEEFLIIMEYVWIFVMSLFICKNNKHVHQQNKY